MQKLCHIAVLLLATALAAPGIAQTTDFIPQPASTATPIPLSGRQQDGSITVEQYVQRNSNSSVNVLAPSLQILGPYAGSSGTSTFVGQISLSLAEAVKIGLQFNLRQIGASNALRQARAQRAADLAALLPSVSANLSETAEKIDLQAEGLSSSTLNALAASGSIFPTTVGPFHYYQAAVNASDNLFDLTALHNLHAASENAEGTALSAQQARQNVVLAVCGSYLQALANQALVSYDLDQVKYAQAVYDQASAQYQAGTKAEIDVTRSLVELHSEQERLASDLGTEAKQKLQLARLIGLSPDAELTLTSMMSDNTTLPLKLQDAIRQADSSRADLRAAEAQLRVAEQTLKAAHAEHLPTASAQGNYGIEGINPNKGVNVFTATASINLPIFNGGRTQADTHQAEAALAQRSAELQDQEGQVEFEVRSAYIDLQVAGGQVKLAAENRTLALDSLRQSQDRFAAGAADSVEVVQSQQILGAANRDYVNALFADDLARISLARAMGEAEQAIPNLLEDK